MTHSAPKGGAGRAVASAQRAPTTTATPATSDHRFNLVRFLNEIAANLTPVFLLHRLHGEAVAVVDRRVEPTRHHTGTLACPATDNITIGGLPFVLPSDQPFAVADGHGQAVTFTADDVTGVNLFPISLPRIYLGSAVQPNPGPPSALSAPPSPS